MPNSSTVGAVGRLPPVIYVHFGHRIDPASYVWPVIRLTRTHGNVVVLLTSRTVVVPSDVAACLADREDIDSLANTTMMRALRRVYARSAKQAAAFLGQTREPAERYNLERFFVMHEYMQRSGVKWAMLMDSDAALVSSAGDVLPWIEAHQPACSSAVLGLNAALLTTDAAWSTWAGTSLLSIHVLQDFLTFALHLYDPLKMANVANASVAKAVPINARYWNDMLTWHLYVAVADDAVGKRVGLKAFESSMSVSLRGLRRAAHGSFHLCDLASFGFNNNHVLFMDPTREDRHTRATDLLRPTTFSLYTPELLADSARRFYWRGERMRSIHFWLQKNTVLEVVPPRTRLQSPTCALPPFENHTWTKVWAKAGALLGIARARHL